MQQCFADAEPRVATQGTGMCDPGMHDSIDRCVQAKNNLLYHMLSAMGAYAFATAIDVHFS
jgi:hypothetical protein